MMTKPTLIIITGPTAVGKTDLSIKIAKHFNTEIVSCDSRQLYREISIGTAKPSIKELSEVKHHFINHLSILDKFTTADYAKECNAILSQLFKSQKYVVMTGGTGLYIKSVIEGLDYFPEVSDAIKYEYQQLFENEGLEPLHSELALKDPIYFKQVDKKNSRRVIRALTVIKASSKPYSSFLTADKQKNSFDYKYFVLNRPRPLLYERINKRVDQMITNGLVEEAQSVHSFRNLSALNTVGYKELFAHFDENCSLDFAIDKIKQHSRNYAKRQLTWFKKIDEAYWLESGESNFEEIIKLVDE